MALAPRRPGSRSNALHQALTLLRAARDKHAPLETDDRLNVKMVSLKSVETGLGTPVEAAPAQTRSDTSSKAAAVRVRKTATQKAASAKYQSLLHFADSFERKIDSRLAALRAENSSIIANGNAAVQEILVRRTRHGQSFPYKASLMSNFNCTSSYCLLFVLNGSLR
jgi:hypothetical protein